MREPLHLRELIDFCENNVCVKETVRSKIKQLIAEDLMSMDICFMEEKLSDSIITFQDEATSLVIYFYNSENKLITYIYALDVDTICGTARCMEDEDGKSVFVNKIYVDKAVRRTGLCNLFLEFLETYELGPDHDLKVSLESDHGHLMGIDDKEQAPNIGFKIAKRRQYEIKDDVAIAHYANNKLF